MFLCQFLFKKFKIYKLKYFLGDILGGAIALCSYWAKLKRLKNAKENNNSQYLTNDLMIGALAASQLQRRASLYAYQVNFFIFLLKFKKQKFSELDVQCKLLMF